MGMRGRRKSRGGGGVTGRTHKKPRPFPESLEEREMLPPEFKRMETYVPARARCGENIVVNPFEIQNAGTTASGSFQVEWYLSQDSTGSSGDYLLGLSNGAFSYLHPGIAGGGVSGGNKSVTLQLPSNPVWPGTSFFII